MDNAAIQNLDFLRRLIAESRSEPPVLDMLRLRMLRPQGVGLTAITTNPGDK